MRQPRRHRGRPLGLTLLFLALLTLAAGADVAGRVTDAVSGQPVAGANVTAGDIATVTGDDGSFHLPGEPDSLTVTHVAYRRQRLAARPGVVVRLTPSTARLREVVVHAGLTEESLQRVTSSVTVVDSAQLRQGQHLQDLTASIPNLNWAGGTSRPQYFQVRGIGERSNYAGEGPPSFSVGTVVDDVDLSGLATGGLLFDLDQVEVYRGPQSTIFGANAMAGLIHLRSADPLDRVDAGVRLGGGGDGLLDGSAFVNLPLAPDLAVRAGVAHDRGDGFRDNAFLGRHDTNRRRESVARLKALWTPGAARWTATAFRVDADNGYDAWAPDNNEDLVTYSDRPGVDAQKTTGASLRAELPLAADLRLVSISAWSRTTSHYAYDSDWGNDAFWRRAPYGFDADVEGYAYDFYDDMHRVRRAWTGEARLVHERLPIGGSGVAGVFVRRLRQETDATGYLFGGDAADLASTFDIDAVAVYARHRRQITARTALTATLRADHDDTAYDGVTDGGAGTVRFDTGGWLVGGRLGLNADLGGGRTAFASVARGYRAGGVNEHPRLAPENRPYDAEYVLDTEVGARWVSARGRLSLTAFHGRRSDQQVELSTQQDAGDPNSFVYFADNAGTGWNAGVELDGDLALTPGVGLSGSLGTLRTHVDAYSFRSGQGQTVTLGDREAAHAPSYTLRLAVRTTTDRGPQGSLEFTAMDGFFYSDSHDQRADGHALWNAGVGWRGAGWSVRLWGRNLLDARYTVRGFYFGLEPPDYADTLYVSYGDPRQLGVTWTADLGWLDR